MAIQTTIPSVDAFTTVLPVPPNPDDQDTYDSRGSAYAPKWRDLGSEMKNFTLPTLQTFIQKVNDFADEMNSTATSVNTHADNAASSASSASSYEALAQKWATYTGGYVSGTQYSAKHWAQKAHEYATSGNYGDVSTDAVNEFNYAQRSKLYDLAYASTITIDLRDGNDYIVTLTGDVTIANPTNHPTSGHTQGGSIYIKQDSTGGRTVSWGDDFIFINNDDPDTAANKTNVYTYKARNGKIEILYIGSY